MNILKIKKERKNKQMKTKKLIFWSLFISSFIIFAGVMILSAKTDIEETTKVMIYFWSVIIMWICHFITHSLLSKYFGFSNKLMAGYTYMLIYTNPNYFIYRLEHNNTKITIPREGETMGEVGELYVAAINHYNWRTELVRIVIE